MQIGQVKLDTDLPATALQGELSDQAALAGVLNTLYELHLPLLLVRRLSIGLENAAIDSTPSFGSRSGPPK